MYGEQRRHWQDTAPAIRSYSFEKPQAESEPVSETVHSVIESRSRGGEKATNGWGGVSFCLLSISVTLSLPFPFNFPFLSPTESHISLPFETSAFNSDSSANC